MLTPAILIDADAMERNLRRMQRACTEAGVELWPHVKTHKMIPVLRRQLALGAAGATCAKVGEAEELLPSGVRNIFIAHSLGDRRHAPRLRALREQLDKLILAVTSEEQAAMLDAILADAGISVPVLMAVDTGLGREGARDAKQASLLAARIRASDRMQLIGIYTHEGHAYAMSASVTLDEFVANVHRKLAEFAQAAGGGLSLWPGCSVTAEVMARQAGVRVVRPGSYVFGDLSLTEAAGIMKPADAALIIFATVVDRPTPDLALIDAGAKVFSSDKSANGLFARCVEHPTLAVTRLSEEHGFLTGVGVDALRVGQRLRFQPAHVCPVVNLASHVHVIRDGDIETWPVDARGRSD